MSRDATPNVTRLSNARRATYSQIACLDANGDHRLNGADALDPEKVPDFDGDGHHDAQDATFLKGIDIPLDPQREQEACSPGRSSEPEYAVAHGYVSSPDVSCEGSDKPVLLVGIGGGAVNLRDPHSAAGVRSMVDGIQSANDDHDVRTIAILAGPAIAGGQNVHSAMETWLTHAVQVYLDRYPCLRLVLLGHSHGAVTADVVASRLEGAYAQRIIDVVDVDRFDQLHDGDTQSRPVRAHVFNTYEHNGGVLQGAPYDSPNAGNWDASDQQAPRDGDEGGPLEAVNHTTIDNSASVKRVIVAEVMTRIASANAWLAGGGDTC